MRWPSGCGRGRHSPVRLGRVNNEVFGKPKSGSRLALVDEGKPGPESGRGRHSPVRLDRVNNEGVGELKTLSRLALEGVGGKRFFLEENQIPNSRRYSRQLPSQPNFLVCPVQANRATLALSNPASVPRFFVTGESRFWKPNRSLRRYSRPLALHSILLVCPGWAPPPEEPATWRWAISKECL